MNKKLLFFALFWMTLPAARPQELQGTELLTEKGDFADKMLSGMERYLERETQSASAGREQFWNRDYSSPQAYERSVAPNRERFRRIIGVVDSRVSFRTPSAQAPYNNSGPVAAGAGYKVYAIRWPVLPGMDAEGLLLEPDRTPLSRVVAVPDATDSPETLAGLAPEVPQDLQFARRLAENGAEVIVPLLLDRSATGIANPLVPRATNQTHREFIYRMAYEVGRHVIGLEVQKILAAVDWLSEIEPRRPIGVIGYGEGGLLALYSAACDSRIQGAGVIGYFQGREELWREPVYRNVWGILREFGDAELAGLVAPRTLAIQAGPAPRVPEPALATGIGAAPGHLDPPTAAAVRREFDRAHLYFERLGSGSSLGWGRADELLWRALTKIELRPISSATIKTNIDRLLLAARQQRQFHQMIDFIQAMVHNSEFARREFWSKADSTSIERWKETKERYRQYLWEEVIGRLPAPSEPLAASTRLIYDMPKWRGYEVWLPVWKDVFAYGVLLLPKDLRSGERRPVVVTQHGRAGRPQDLIDPSDTHTEQVYKRFAAQLAERGFIVYAPQSPYIFEERYRFIQRRANPLKVSLFSFILGQHERTLDWIASLPFVNASRIGFYGLSYGGKTALRVPSLLDKYALSICSGDFNEYTRKMAGLEMSGSFMYTIEHEAYEFNLANTFDHSEMASLMAPRPFMVERGHDDPVGQDEWVAYEYAKVRRFYARLKIPERTRIEFFDGVHEINLKGTLDFLEEYLK